MQDNESLTDDWLSRKSSAIYGNKLSHKCYGQECHRKQLNICRNVESAVWFYFHWKPLADIFVVNNCRVDNFL